jgi:acetate---CoA ligase (ADP-forming) subunit alpha
MVPAVLVVAALIVEANKMDFSAPTGFCRRLDRIHFGTAMWTHALFLHPQSPPQVRKRHAASFLPRHVISFEQADGLPFSSLGDCHTLLFKNATTTRPRSGVTCPTIGNSSLFRTQVGLVIPAFFCFGNFGTVRCISDSIACEHTVPEYLRARRELDVRRLAPRSGTIQSAGCIQEYEFCSKAERINAHHSSRPCIDMEVSPTKERHMDMTLRERLDRMFSPRSVAVIGAGAEPDKVGHAIMDSIVTGGFPGRIYPIHPRHREIMGLPVYRDLADLPEIPDLAVVALNQHSTVSMTARLRELGVAGASLIAGGYLEMGAAGAKLQQELREAAGDMPVVGPNTLGFLNARAHLNVTFYPRTLSPGTVSFLSQSGGIGLAIQGRADDEGLGIAKWVGVGNRVNLEFHTLLDYLKDDPETRVIGIFTEGTADGGAFIRHLSRVTREKPVVVYKGGLAEDADKVTVSHTGAAAGPARLWEGTLRQAGALTVSSASEMVSVCKALSIGKAPRGKRVGIFTHTAGPSIVAWDTLRTEPGCELSQLGRETIRRISEILGPSVPVIHKNPVDGAAGAFLTRPFHDIAEAILEDASVDALLTIFCEHKNWIYPSDALIELAGRFPQPIVTCFIGSVRNIGPDRSRLHAAGVPTYVMPEDAALGLKALLTWHGSRKEK